MPSGRMISTSRVPMFDILPPEAPTAFSVPIWEIYRLHEFGFPAVAKTEPIASLVDGIIGVFDSGKFSELFSCNIVSHSESLPGTKGLSSGFLFFSSVGIAIPRWPK